MQTPKIFLNTYFHTPKNGGKKKNIISQSLFLRSQQVQADDSNIVDRSLPDTFFLNLLFKYKF